MPEQGEVLQGKVVDVTPSGLNVQSGPINCFIPLQKNSGEYRWDVMLNHWQRHDEEDYLNDCILKQHSRIVFKVI